MNRRALTGAIFLSAGLAGCGGTTSETVTVPQIEDYRIVRIAVLPFKIAPPTLGQKRGYAAPAPPPAAAEKLSEIFFRKLNNREGVAVVPPQYVKDAMPATSVASHGTLKELGERLDVGAVMEGTVEVYKEREGSKVGLYRAEDAAAVGFAVRLVSVKDGKILWMGEYYEQQRPVNEDLQGFLERGAKFVTVEQLAESAADHVLREFPLGRQIQRRLEEPSPAP